MNPVDKQLAEAVVAQLVAGLAADPCPFGTFTFTPERKRLASLKIDATLRVWVVASEQDTDAAARDEDHTDYELQIGILRKIVSRETVDDEVDQLVGLAEAIRDWLRDHPISNFEMLRASLSPTYDHPRLLKNNEFLSIVVCSYRTYRERAETEDDE